MTSPSRPIAESQRPAETGGRVVVVTGAARGIGLAIARRFLLLGDRVIGLDVDQEELARARKTFVTEELAGTFETYRVDVAAPASVDQAFQSIARDHASVQVLVNNAGITLAQPFADTSLAQWETVLAINLTGAFLCTQAALSLFVGPGVRRIINISSHSGQRGSRNRAAYAASKGGLDALTRVLAVELAAQGVRVNGIAPGPVDTPHSRAAHSSARRSAWFEALPIKRYAQDDEIAAAVQYLASSDADFITGQILSVDGGFTAAGLLEG